jgi:hypothetical protein
LLIGRRTVLHSWFAVGMLRRHVFPLVGNEPRPLCAQKALRASRTCSLRKEVAFFAPAPWAAPCRRASPRNPRRNPAGLRSSAAHR